MNTRYWIVFLSIFLVQETRTGPKGTPPQQRSSPWHLTRAKSEMHKNPHALFDALKLENLVRARWLINAGADVNALNERGWSPLHLAIIFRQEKVIEFLLQNGAHVDIANTNGTTPLHMAVGSNNNALAKILLQYGARLDIRDGQGCTCLYSCTSGSAALAKILMGNSFFEPSYHVLPPTEIQSNLDTRILAQPALLRSFCIAIVAQRINDYAKETIRDVIVPTLSCLDTASYTSIADQIPLLIQRMMIATWNDDEGKKCLERFLVAHYQRHLAYLQSFIAMKNNKNYTARDLLHARKQDAIIKLLDHVCTTNQFDNLDEQLRKLIVANMTQRLASTNNNTLQS